MSRISKLFTFILTILLLVGMFSDCAKSPEITVDIEKMRKDAMELCEENFDGPGYVTLILDSNDTLKGVRIELPDISNDGKICGTVGTEFGIDGSKNFDLPYFYTDIYEELKNLNAVRVLKGIYGDYLLYEDGTLEYIGGIDFEQFLINPEYYNTCVIDETVFCTDILKDKYGIVVSDIMYSVVTAAYLK